MLKSKRYRAPRPKGDWFNKGRKSHFDTVLSRPDAERLVKDAMAVALHDFLPLMSFVKVERRFRNRPNGKPRAKLKKRQIVYASNKDGYIYSYYAEILSICYDNYLKMNGLDDIVVGYRSGRSNISVAQAAFDEILARGACTAIAYDIEHFFDNISHGVLKENWREILGVINLPSDHFNVFAGLTRSRFVDRSACLVRLGIDPKAKNSKLPTRLCTPQEFRQLICSSSGIQPKLLSSERRVGIPQGTPISAVAANISMLNFDKAMNELLLRLNGSYRRYSDDILIICPTGCVIAVEDATKQYLLSHTKTLSLSTEKTLRVDFPRPQQGGSRSPTSISRFHLRWPQADDPAWNFSAVLRANVAWRRMGKVAEAPR